MRVAPGALPLFLTQYAFLSEFEDRVRVGGGENYFSSLMEGEEGQRPQIHSEETVLWSHRTGGRYMLVTSDVYFPAREMRRE